ncbi:MAG: nitroreductase [Acholeplasmataceae bacterium]|nr:nitroreductase [Acholeplasmataceae bacterium]
MSIKEIIKGRVSNSKFINSKIEVKEIIGLLDDAVYAPNHKMREPWRFIILEGEGKLNFIKKYLNETKSEEKEESKKIIEKVFNAPMVVAFIMPRNVNFADELEDLQAISAVIQNFLLLLEEKEYGSFWKTPKYIESDLFKEVLGLNTNEIIAGLVMVGKVEIKNQPKPRKKASDITTIYS